jgi:hypothetical protein
MARGLATFGIYSSMSALHTGAEALTSEGFRQTDISLLYSDRGSATMLTHDATSDAVDLGLSSRAFAGGILGYLAGIGALTIPGIGPLLAAGPLTGAFTGAAALSSNGLIGALVGLGLPEHEAKCYEGCLKDGGILFSVYCDDAEWAGRAKTILTRTGAAHLAAAAETEPAYQI